MILDNSPSWLSGGLAVSIIGYGLLSAFVIGPTVVLPREAEKLNWSEQCKRMVVAEVRQSQSQEEFVPQIDYRDMARSWFGRDAEPLLQLMQPLGQIMDQANAQKERAKRLNEERLQRKAQAAGSRCDCAVTMLGEQRIALGLYSGTGRLVTPPLFKNLASELQTSLRSPRCADVQSNDGR